jgi:hyperosmotically inducible protein
VRILKCLTILAVLLTSTGCVALLVGGAAVGGYYVGKDERSAAEIADDAAIVAAINARYVRDDLVRARDIDVDSWMRVVTLRGKVASDEARKRAIEIARGVNNVFDVVADELVVDTGR